MRFADEVLIQLRLVSDDLSEPTLEELARIFIAAFEIVLIIFRVFAAVIIGIVKVFDWLAVGLENLPALPARWSVGRIRFVPPIG